MPKIIPAILEKTEAEVFSKARLLKRLGLKTAHIDVMDGLAVPNICWGDPETASRLPINLEIHLMVKRPLAEARRWLFLPNVIRVIVRGEEVDDMDEYSSLSKASKKLGLAVDPGSNLLKIISPAKHLKYILIMGVTSGFSGQKFNEQALINIELIKKARPKARLGVDGGMNEETIPLVKQKGVDVINAASYFWAGDQEKKIKFIENF